MSSLSVSPRVMTLPLAGSKRRAEETTPTGFLGSRSITVIVDNLPVLKALQQTIEYSHLGPLPVEFVLDEEIHAANEACNRAYGKYEGKEGWARDNRVVRHDGTHVISYPFNIVTIQAHLHLFCLMNHIHNPSGSYDLVPCGRGSQFIDEAHQHATRVANPVAFSECVLEGGNVILFTDKEGRQKAIIGTHSIALSIIALEQENYFDVFEELEGEVLSDLFVTKARNIDLLERREANGLSEKQFLEKAFTPLTAEEKADPHLIHKAKTLESKWFIAQQLIADELVIPVENIAWIDQEHFHIDLDTSVIAGCAFVYDGFETIKALDALLALPLYKSDPILTEYRRFAAQSATQYLTLNEKNRTEFEKIGVKMIPVPGRFETTNPTFPDKPTFNFLNGILLPTQRPKEKIYAIAPCSYPELFKEFVEVIHKSIPPGIIIRPLPIQLIERGHKGVASVKDPIGEMLTEYWGGLRCMTNMVPFEADPLEETPSPAATLTFETSSPISDKS